MKEIEFECTVYNVRMQAGNHYKIGLIIIPETSSIEHVKEDNEYAEDYNTYEEIGEITTTQSFLNNEDFDKCHIFEHPEKCWYEYLHCEDYR